MADKLQLDLAVLNDPEVQAYVNELRTLSGDAGIAEAEGMLGVRLRPLTPIEQRELQRQEHVRKRTRVFDNFEERAAARAQGAATTSLRERVGVSDDPSKILASSFANEASSFLMPLVTGAVETFKPAGSEAVDEYPLARDLIRSMTPQETGAQRAAQVTGMIGGSLVPTLPLSFIGGYGAAAGSAKALQAIGIASRIPRTARTASIVSGFVGGEIGAGTAALYARGVGEDEPLGKAFQSGTIVETYHSVERIARGDGTVIDWVNVGMDALNLGAAGLGIRRALKSVPETSLALRPLEDVGYATSPEGGRPSVLPGVVETADGWDVEFNVNPADLANGGVGSIKYRRSGIRSVDVGGKRTDFDTGSRPVEFEIFRDNPGDHLRAVADGQIFRLMRRSDGGFFTVPDVGFNRATGRYEGPGLVRHPHSGRREIPNPDFRPDLGHDPGGARVAGPPIVPHRRRLPAANEYRPTGRHDATIVAGPTVTPRNRQISTARGDWPAGLTGLMARRLPPASGEGGIPARSGPGVDGGGPLEGVFRTEDLGGKDVPEIDMVPGIKETVSGDKGSVRFDLEGHGTTPDTTNIEYMGFTTWMSPRQFLALNPKATDRGSLGFLRAAVDRGDTIAPPRVSVEVDKNGDFEVIGHEGRHRSMVFSEVIGGDTRIPVQVFPVGKRARHFTPDTILGRKLRPDQEGGTAGLVIDRVRLGGEVFSARPTTDLARTPSTEIREVATKYLRAARLPVPMQRGVTPPHDPALAIRIADAYESANHAPDDPVVQEAYKGLVAQTAAQAAHALRTGKIQPVPYAGKGEPYANSAEMIRDVRENKRLLYLKTVAEGDTNFGGAKNASELAKDNPLLARTGRIVKDSAGNDHAETWNDVFRWVHDYYGHAMEGNGFGPKGEEAAWWHHAQMFTGLARMAMTTETRGQNSWVNYGPHLRRPDGSVPMRSDPDFIPLQDRPFAEQKITLLPEEFSTPKAMKVVEPVIQPGLFKRSPRDMDAGPIEKEVRAAIKNNKPTPLPSSVGKAFKRNKNIKHGRPGAVIGPADVAQALWNAYGWGWHQMSRLLSLRGFTMVSDFARWMMQEKFRKISRSGPVGQEISLRASAATDTMIWMRGHWVTELNAQRKRLSNPASKAVRKAHRELRAQTTLYDEHGRPYATLSNFSLAVEGRTRTLPGGQVIDPLTFGLSKLSREAVDLHRRVTLWLGKQAESMEIEQTFSPRSTAGGITGGAGARKFKHTPGGRVWVRRLNDLGYEILEIGERHPLWDPLVYAIAKANGTPITHANHTLSRWRQDSIDRKAAFEVVREIPVFPHAIIDQHGQHWDIQDADPMTATDSLLAGESARLSFIGDPRRYKPSVDPDRGRHFGQDPDGLDILRSEWLQEARDSKRGLAHTDEFDFLMRELNGMPTFDPQKFTALAKWNEVNRQMAGVPELGKYSTDRLLSAILVTGSALVQTTETVRYSIQSPYGTIPTLHAALREIANGIVPDRIKILSAAKAERDALIREGAIKPMSPLNWHLLPTDPEFHSKQTSAGRKVTMAAQHWLNAIAETAYRAFFVEWANELSGRANVRAAYAFFEKHGADIISGKKKLSNAQIAGMKIMGYDEAVITRLKYGGATKADIKRILVETRRVTSGMAGAGPQHSQMETNPATKFLVKFQSYFSNVARQAFRAHDYAFNPKYSQATRRGAWVGLAKLYGGLFAAGIASKIVMGLQLGGVSGVKQELDDIVSDPTGTIAEAYSLSVGGGIIGSLLRTFGQDPYSTGAAEDIGQILTSFFPSVRAAEQVWTALQGTQMYDNQGVGERAFNLTVSMFPGFKRLRTGMAMLGLVDADVGVEHARRRFYQWYYSQPDHVQLDFERNEGDEYLRKMRAAYKQVIGGDTEEGVRLINEALESEDAVSALTGEVRDWERSFKSRLIMPKLTKDPELYERAVKQLGAETMRKLELHDRLLMEVLGPQ